MAPETREKVRAAALELGYHPDPLLSRALSRVRQTGANHYRETVAFIIEWKTETGPHYQKRVHAAALEQASSMGYKLESFIVSGKQSEQRQLNRILQARGIRGLIIIPRLGSPQPRLQFDWQHFATVAIGYTLRQPRNLHRVESADYVDIIEALHLLKKVGYRRIGMAVEPTQNRNQYGCYYAAYLLSQIRQSPRQRLPIFAPTGPWNEKTFRRWMEQFRPDVLVVHQPEVISSWLSGMGLRVPQDVSLFCANAQEDRWSGLRRNYAGIGRAVVEMISLLLVREEYGLPGNPRSLLVSEFWQEGRTLSRSIGRYVTTEGFLRQDLLRGKENIPREASAPAVAAA